MSGSYRSLIVAACGLTIAASLGIGAYVGSLYAPSHKYYQAASAQQSAQQNYNGPSQSLTDIAAVPGPVERAIANPPPATGQDHERRDLAAQEASAAWAFWMVLASYISAIVTTVGTVFLYKQIRLTRVAVEDTSRATSAMERQNDLAENMAKRQLRAYLYVELKEAPKLELGGRPMGEFWLKNGGQTPAYNVRVANAFSIGRYPFEGEPEPIMEHHFGGMSTKNPNAPSVLQCRALDGGLSQRWIDAITAGTRRIVMYGEVRYDDIFGDPHVTTYRAEFGGPDTASGDCVIWGATGNSST